MLNINSPRLKTILTFIFFIILFIVCITPLRDFDIWFNLKSGELFYKQGIIFYDVFSYTAQGREWIPHQWAFQIGLFLLEQNFGLDSIKYVVAFIQTIQLLLIFLILRRIFKLNLLLSFFLVLFHLTATFEFVTARGHVPAYTFFLAVLYFILEFIKTSQKKWLIPIAPIILVWSNIHSSMFLSIGLLGAYSGVLLTKSLFFKEKDQFKNFKVLSLFTVGASILTILPPLGFSQYRLLWKFSQYNEVLRTFIDEWAPLINHQFGFFYYTGTTIITILFLTIYLLRTKKFKQVLLLLPLLPFPFLAFVASRNVVLGVISQVLILGWLLAQTKLENLKGSMRYLLIITFLVLTATQIYFLHGKKLPTRLYYPVNAVEFIKKYNLQGNMYNEYGYGGYLLYMLYPERQVFIDGRTEMYLCCEMPYTLELSYKKLQPDNEYKVFLDGMWDKYGISYAIMRPQKHSVLRKIARVLTDDPNWSLVFWDDNSMIYVRRDGKNDQIIKDLGVKAATPYNQNPIRENMEDQAFEEYQRMIQVTDSSKSRNAIGFILLKRQQYAEAAIEFQKAVELDPSNESPYMNLAELAAKDKDYPTAIKNYETALKLAPDRGLIYIRLGQLYLQNGEDLNKAKSTWQKGVENTVDEDAKKHLQELLAK